MRTLVVSALAVLLFAGSGAVARQNDPNLDKLLEQYQMAWNKGDAKGLAALYTQTALRLPPEGPAVSGRAAIEKLFVQNFQGAWKGTKLTLKAVRTQEVAPNVRIQEGTYEVAGGADGPQRGRYMNTVVREGNDWKLASVAPVADTPAK
jgi:uncharacterized protein (TIGR02246 family)